MAQYPSEQNSTQISGAANGTWSLHAALVNIENHLMFDNADELFQSFPPGYRFIPTDEELIVDYLMKKANDEPLYPNLIRVVTFYGQDPTLLIENSSDGSANSITENKWYFFTSRDKKYPKGSRPNRATPNGYWKPTGKDITIFQSQGSRHPVGKKRTLDFYEGKHPLGVRTVWKMHEYTLVNNSNNRNSLNNGRPRGDMTLDDWVLCKLYKNQRSDGDEASTSGNGTQNPNTSQPTPIQASMYQQPLNVQSFGNANSSQHPNGLSLSRATPNVYWNPTETYGNIPPPHASWHPVGRKRILDFNEGEHPRGGKTVRIMQEPTLEDDNNNSNHISQNNVWPRGDMTLDDRVLCQVCSKECNGGDKASTSGCEIQSPTVNLAQNNEAANSKVGDGDIELQNQPIPNQRSTRQELSPSSIERLIDNEEISWADILESVS